MAFLQTIIYFFPYNISRAMLIILVLDLAFLLFFTLFPKKITSRIKANKRVSFLLVFLIILLGLWARLNLAYFTKGNFDIDSFKLVAGIVEQGGNVYEQTSRYNYSPVWFYLLFFLGKINSIFPTLSFNFIIRAWGSLVDLVSLFLLYKISGQKKLYFPLVAAGFFLNPVSIILTGHHGQFENLTILLILAGVYFYYKNVKSKLGFLLFVLAGIIKHIVFNQILVFLNHHFKNRKKIVYLFVFSIILFLLTFLPFWQKGGQGIVENVFLYKSRSGYYGLTRLFFKLGLNEQLQMGYSFIFMAGLFLFAYLFKGKSLVKSILVNFLFFLSFTPGMADQYLVLPLAVASLNPGMFFIVYTFTASLYLFRSPAQLVIKKYSFVTDLLLWLVITAWFFVKLNKDKVKKPEL